MTSKLFKTILILTAFAATTCQASSDGMYTGVQGGVAGADFGGSGGYGRLLLGDQINRFFAFEAGATLLPHTAAGSGGFLSNADEGKAYTLDGDAKLMLPIGSRFNFYVKAGPSVGYVEADSKGMALLGNAALGMNLDLTEHVSTDLSISTMLGQRGFIDGFAGLGLSYHFA
ncbi:MAG: porin family protein [Gammaproteobacteria bacterium]|nr:porin family protein [Gammaproteobacteria bacterium]